MVIYNFNVRRAVCIIKATVVTWTREDREEPLSIEIRELLRPLRRGVVNWAYSNALTF
jgi:hypothetical protein